MNQWIKYCLKNPVGVFVAAIFLLLFGLMALQKMPYQLLPQVVRPVVSIYTSWSGATPYEIEKEITEKQEKYLKNIPNLLSITSTSKQGMAIITLEFDVDVNLQNMLLNVTSRLEEVRGYPTDASKPIVKMTGENVPISVYLFAKTLHPSDDIDTYKNFISDEIIKYYERIDGVGEVYVSGGRKKQIFITLDTQKLAFFHIGIDDVIASIKKQNVNISAGSMNFSQRSYRITTTGEYTSLDSIRDTVIKTLNHKNILLRDVGSVSEGYEQISSYHLHNNSKVISIQIRPTAQANILDLTNRVEELTQKLNQNFLEKRGIVIEWGRDQRQYIQTSINLVKQNILIGIMLSTLVLLIFLRNIMSLVVITLVIPLSIIGSFIVLEIFDRTLNVVLLAGVSFAISMIIDSAIVVLENILRHTKKEQSLFQACLKGTKEVVGALLASSITTIAIFIPIIFLKGDAGKLFIDIAMAASSSIGISFFVCIFIIPIFLYVLLKYKKPQRKTYKTTGYLDNFFVSMGERIATWIMKGVQFCVKNTWRQIASIVIFVGMCGVFSFIAFPKTDYLPKGNQNFIIAYLSVPPGLSLGEKQRIVKILQADFEPYLSKNQKNTTHSEVPLIRDFFISAGDSLYFYLVAENPNRIKELMEYAQESIDSIPNVSGVVLQQEVFSGALSSSIDINITGGNLDSLSRSAGKIITAIKEVLPNLNIRVVPSLELNNQEINLYPDSRNLALNGLNAQSFGTIVEVLLKGKKVGEYRNEGKSLDIILDTKGVFRGREESSPEDILYSQIYTSNGSVVSVGSLARVENEFGVSNIRHFEQKRNLLLILNVKDSMPIEKVTEILQEKVVNPILKDDENDIILSGGAGKLQALKVELFDGFVLAILITYLILCALYGNFLYPFIIILTIPLATTGGLMGLFLVDKFIAKQNLDVLTMFGFIILVGSVVNNAILIVYQTLINQNTYHMSIKESVLDATKTRLVPIYMSMLTSVLALIPLVLFAGNGSEIYRGLGAVLIGGIVFSTLITVLIIPALLLLCLRDKK
ncbi:efflux RND transporter permease subunit [Helicobacter sp. faydin-H20]|uniref:efflux RND transporter permease subunit n=1 Tax=Helicobacter anatolicus TaxID=2905874 RepID=UPI001E46FE36|nr:efflux RND transporter permease subunit [Helicobacter anatolicus]